MKLIGLLILTIVTWYLSGMYRSLPLMALFLTNLLLIPFSLIQALHVGRRVSVGLSQTESVGIRETDCTLRFRAALRGKTPAARVQLTIVLRYRGRGKTVRRLTVALEPGKTDEPEIQVFPPWAGPYTVELRRVRVFDLLGLFSVDAGQRETGNLLVLPPERALRIYLSEDRETWGAAPTSPLPAPGRDATELLGPREYIPGDLIRHIHQPLSARTDRLWVREFSRETDLRFQLTLHLPNRREKGERWDSYYELVYALLLGLLRHAAAVCVFWWDAALRSLDVCSPEDCRMLLLRLYRLSSGTEPAGKMPEDGFCLDETLCWRRGKVIIYHFSPKNLHREIGERTFWIGGT